MAYVAATHGAALPQHECGYAVETTWNGLRAAEIRARRGLKPYDVAQELQTAPSNIMRWELPDGDTKSTEPRASVVRALSLLYGVPCEEFYKQVGEPIRWMRGQKPKPADDTITDDDDAK